MAADPETGRLLVLAPPKVHEQIASQIPASQARGVEKPGDARRAVQPDGPLGFAERFVPLVRSPLERMETALREMFGPRIVPLGSAPGEPRSYRFTDGAGRRVEFSFDPRRSGIRIAGTAGLAGQFARLIRELDGVSQADGRVVEIVPLRIADPVKVQQAVEAYRTGAGDGRPRPLLPSGSEGPTSTSPGRQTRNPRDDDQSRHSAHAGIELASYLFQAGTGSAAGAAPAAPAGAAPGAARCGARRECVERTGATRARRGGATQDRLERLRQLAPDVEIETLPDLDVIILRGRDRDVEELKRMIEEIERLSAETQPVIEIYPLKHVEGEALARSPARSTRTCSPGARAG